MAFLRQWLLGVVSCAFLVSLLDQLTPEGSVRKLARFSGGLVLILCMLRPLGTAEPWELALDLDGSLRRSRGIGGAIPRREWAVARGGHSGADGRIY